MPEHIDSFTLTRWRYGDLTAEESARADLHLATCAECRRRSEQISDIVHRQHGEEGARLSGIHTRYAAVRDRSRAGRAGGYRLPLGIAVAVAVLATVAGSVFLKPKPAPPSTGTARTTDGELSCTAFVKRGDEQLTLSESTRLRPGDRLRFVIYTDAPGYLTVFSVDRGDTPSPLYPASDPSSAPSPLRIDRKGSHALPGAVSVDDIPTGERIVLAFYPEAFDRRSVHRLMSTTDSPEALRRMIRGMSGAVKVFSLRR